MDDVLHDRLVRRQRHRSGYGPVCGQRCPEILFPGVRHPRGKRLVEGSFERRAIPLFSSDRMLVDQASKLLFRSTRLHLHFLHHIIHHWHLDGSR